MRASSVAVVITTFDHARFLESAIRSALDQTNPPSEIIVVDDGSHDRPEEITQRHPTVRLIQKSNAGLAAARNSGWRASSSEFVVFLDADDRLLPEALRLNRELLATDPSAAFSYGAYVNVVAETGTRALNEFRPATEGFADLLRGNLVGMHGTVMYRRDRLDAIGGFDVGLHACEDYDVYLRMTRRYSIRHQATPLAEYWHHGGNMSRDSAMMLRAALLVLRRQKADARRLSMMRAYRTGITTWKRFYVSSWYADVARSVVGRSVAPRLRRQGVSLAREAPLTMIAGPILVLPKVHRWISGRHGRRQL